MESVKPLQSVDLWLLSCQATTGHCAIYLQQPLAPSAYPDWLPSTVLLLNGLGVSA